MATATKSSNGASGTLHRNTFTFSRVGEYFSEKELTARTGTRRENWARMAVKELVDNSLDACETAGTPPEIQIQITEDSVSVADNGPGLPRSTVESVTDFTTRTSSNAKYVSPTRGSQGNALKTILAAPYVLDGQRGRVDVATASGGVRIDVSLNSIRQEPEIRLQDIRTNVKSGTVVRVHWPRQAWGQPESKRDRFLQLAARFAFLNPHLTISLEVDGDELLSCERTADSWEKWTATSPTSPHWYGVSDMCDLMAACIVHDRSLPEPRVRSLREFIGEFRGLSGSKKPSAILHDLGLSRATLLDLAPGDDLDRDAVQRLLSAMQKNSRPIAPANLGIIGEPHLRTRFGEFGGDLDSFKYRCAKGASEGLPYLLEVAFARALDGETRLLISGVNWSTTIGGRPFGRIKCTDSAALAKIGGFQNFDELLFRQHCFEGCPIVAVVHVVTPKPLWQDQGKSSITLEGALADDLVKAFEFVTREWAAERKAAEREENRQLRAEFRRAKQSSRPGGMSLTDAIQKVLPAAIEAASGGGRFVFPGRNLYYAARKLIQDYTDKQLNQKTFDKVVKEWEQEHGIIESMYRDPRGHLIEPHTGKVIPLGTREVQAYEIPPWLYHTILFVEKKGFAPMFREARIAERYDLAILSSEGYATDAAKCLMARAEQDRDTTILCLHDADPYGLNIARRLQDDTLRSKGVRVIDIGLGLDDAVRLGLPMENFERYRALPREITPTDLEQKHFTGVFSKRTRRGGQIVDVYEGQRVELNALAADPDLFISYIEGKLKENGRDRKLIPPSDVIRDETLAQCENDLAALVQEEIRRRLDIDGIVGRTTTAVLTRLDVSRTSGVLADWGADPQPEPWSSVVQHEAQRLVRAQREHVERLVAGELARISA